MNYVQTTREFNASCSWTIRGISWQWWAGAHWHTSSRIVTSSLKVHDLDINFCHDQNFEHFKIFVPTCYAITTCLRTLHAILRLVCALERLQSCQCVPQNFASVKLAYDCADLTEKAPVCCGKLCHPQWKYIWQGHWHKIVSLTDFLL